MVFQFGQLIPELTALDNVALPLLLAGTARKARRTSGRASGWSGSAYAVRGAAARAR